MPPHPDREHSVAVPELYNFPEWRQSGVLLPNFAKELIAGGAAGGLGKTLVAPLDRVKILFQTGSLAGRSVLQKLQHIYRHEGPLGLYKGNGASVMRIVPYASIHFAAFERYRAALQVARGLDPRDPTQQPLPGADLIAGAAAGATAVLFTYPLDLVRTRLAYISDQPVGGAAAPRGPTSPFTSSCKPSATSATLSVSGTGSSGECSSRRSGVTRLGLSGDNSCHSSSEPRMKHRAGGEQQQQEQQSQHQQARVQQQQQQRQGRHARIRRMVSGILQREGAAGLYRGLGPTMVGILPYAGLKFYIYQSSKQRWRTSTGQKSGQHVPVPLMLAFGALSGLVAQTATYPLDVVRRRMQVQALHQVEGKMHLRGTWHGLKTVAASGGIRALFAGLSINYVKVVPATAIGFTLYDSLKQLLGLTSSV